MIDTHAHLASKEFQNDLKEVVDRAKVNNITEIWIPGTNGYDYKELLKVKGAYPNFFKLFAGIHPEEIEKNYDGQIQAVELALKSKEFVGVGEIGLDYYCSNISKELQKEVFIKQLELAIIYDFPVSLHIREAYLDAMEILKPFFKKGLKGIFHCYSGDIKTAQEIIKTNKFMFGIGGIVTFKNSNIPQLLQDIPLEYVVTETDAPYLSPTPNRGKRNESSYIPLIVSKLARIYNKKEIEIEKATIINANKIFKKD